MKRLRALDCFNAVLAGVLCILAFAFRHSGVLGWTLVALGALLVALGIAQALATHRRVRRVALESHLLQQPLEADTFAACLQRDDHLWARSVVLQALRAAEQQPTPGRLRPEEHLKQLHTLISHHVRPLRPPLLRLNLLVVAALVGFWTLEAPPGDIALRYGVGVAALLLVVELVETRLAWRAQDAADSLALGLSAWVLDHPNETAPPRRKPAYHHERLYLDRPWAPA